MINYSRYQHLRITKENKIATVVLNHPEVRNRLVPGMHEELEDVFEDLSRDHEVNVVVITGEGQSFCAGGDITEMLSGKPRSTPLAAFGRVRRLINNILNTPQPIIAAVNGDAIGAGATLALFCDIIIMSENARIGDAHVRVGLVAGDGGTAILPLLVGVHRAKELLLTGNYINAKEADRIGLVNRVVALNELKDTVTDLAETLASGATLAINLTKLCMNKRLKEEVNLTLDAAIAMEGLTMSTADHKEGVNAFLEKRSPHFMGE